MDNVDIIAALESLRDPAKREEIIASRPPYSEMLPMLMTAALLSAFNAGKVAAQAQAAGDTEGFGQAVNTAATNHKRAADLMGMVGLLTDMGIKASAELAEIKSTGVIPVPDPLEVTVV